MNLKRILLVEDSVRDAEMALKALKIPHGEGGTAPPYRP